ncbi:helix-turn-helix transcriptional regulator [Streptacidiphilus sp. MAP5-3]|uniref:helix-turn-helix transcriptional regulator n=1 Tax=unclassified Streptacidiphilus TaxID=2643834 RepID=UPI003518F16B
MDRAGLADFLRKRREMLQPEDVGLPRGSRRRTAGLRREEVAALADMSTDYYSRVERQRGPQPSEQMLARLARGLHLTSDERDHLFLLAGHSAPLRAMRSDHVSPGMMRILDRLDDTPAQVVSGLGETLVQTRLSVALVGDETHFTGPARSIVYRWYTDPAARLLYPSEDHELLGRTFTSQLRESVTREGVGSRAADLADALLERSAEFAACWNAHEVGLRLTAQRKRLVHPELGLMELYCQVLLDPAQSQSLLVYTAPPGTESHQKLQLLGVIGAQRFQAGLPQAAD